jgi:Pyrimidine dimer DNA glycosylase
VTGDHTPSRIRLRTLGQTGTVQTFLPYADFERSARVLDPKRLGKQRVETIQVVRALTRPGYGWANHPAVLMWKGFEEALGRYGYVCCEVWTELGFGDTCAATIAADLRAAGVDTVRTQPELATAGALPPWLGDEAVHRSHRSALVRKDATRYRPLFPEVPDDLPYVWPVRSEAVIVAEQRKVENEARRERRALERARLDAERRRRQRSRAAKKAWQTRRRNATLPTPIQHDGAPGD